MPNKYEAFNGLFRLGMCETKALLFLRYDEDPESMDYKTLETKPPAHDKFKPAHPEDIAKRTRCTKNGMYGALKECFFQGLVSRQEGMPRFGVGKAARVYFLDEKQDEMIRRMERLAMLYYDMKKH